MFSRISGFFGSGAKEDEQPGSTAGESSPTKAVPASSSSSTPAKSTPTSVSVVLSPKGQKAASLLTTARPDTQVQASQVQVPTEMLQNPANSDPQELSRALISLYMSSPGFPPQLKIRLALLVIVKQAKFTHEIRIIELDEQGGSPKLVYTQAITSALSFYFRPHSHTVNWTISLNGVVHALTACFGHDNEEAHLKQLWNFCYLEVGSQRTEYAKLDEYDRNMAIRANDDMEESEDEQEDKDELDFEEQDFSRLSMSDFPANSNIRFSNKNEKSYDADEEDEEESKNSFANAKNDSLAVGMLLNRTFVNRGSQIGVFKHDSDGSLQYLNNIPVVRDMSGHSFAPSQMLLHDQDSKMMLLNHNDEDTIYEFDLEYGKVVQEFDAGEDIKGFRSLNGRSKLAERGSEQTFLGVNKNAVFSLDARQNSRNKLADHKLYKTVPNFRTLASTIDGYVAVGSDDGNIRLYDSVSKIAKTNLSGLGDGIIGIDVTAGGDYILATTKNYLLVIPTAVEGQEKNGFKQSITSKSKAPIKLQLTPYDIAEYQIKDVSFTHAKFNVSEGEGREEFICTSTGNYLVTWNFTKVKQGKLFHYKLKKCASEVIADQFLFNHRDKMVVSLPYEVTLQNMQNKHI